MAESLTFDAYTPDGAPRVFVGMFRPPVHEIDWLGYCERANILAYQRGDLQREWLAGTFDRALYADWPDAKERA